MVAFTARYLHEWLFYLYYLLIFGLYFHSLVELFSLLSATKCAHPPPLARSWMIPSAKLGFITLFVILHAGMVRWLSARFLGVDYPWFFQAGVAGQYVLGFGLQPSVCGVFLLISIVRFLRDRPWSAVIWACLAAILHATYFPAAVLLTLAYMTLLYRQRGFWNAVRLGGGALILVTPSLIYTLASFAPSSAEEFAAAQHILAHVRLPHHAEVDRWFDGIACVQVVWIILAMFLAQRSHLFVVMLVLFLGSSILTVVQLATGNDSLALLFPWRTSVVLIPLATTVILARIIGHLEPWLQTRGALFRVTCLFVLAGCTACGLAVPVFELGYRTSQDERPLLDFIKQHHQLGDVYLVPVKVPKANSGGRGVFSSNFTPAPRRGKAGSFLAIDLQQFRLATATPLFVDFKSVPYQDKEVLEWWRRISWCTDIYVNTKIDRETLRAALTKKGITHVVAPAHKQLPFSELGAAIYEDGVYCIFPVAKK